MDLFSKLCNQLGEPGSLGRGNPVQSESFRINPQIFKYKFHGLSPGKSFVITIQVMTFTKVSAKDQYAVGSLFQGFHHQIGMDHA